MRLSTLAVILVLMTSIFASGVLGALRVVATGDSLTVGYSEYLAPMLLDMDPESSFTMAAYSGMNAQMYVGTQAYRFNDVNYGIKDVPAEVMLYNPDVICLMLGTNNALSLEWNSYAFPVYCIEMERTLKRFSNFINSHGIRPVVILANLPPMTPLEYRYPMAEPAIENQFNPWIESKAKEYGFVFFDVFRMITSHPDWETWSTDGVHFLGCEELGKKLMAEYFCELSVDLFEQVTGDSNLLNGDANGDGVVNVLDLGILSKYYGLVDRAYGFPGDFSGDGRINVIDLGVLAANYSVDKTDIQELTVPDPATLSLLALGGMAILRRGSK
jgi:lysophospholipase L1-like esterase